MTSDDLRQSCHRRLADLKTRVEVAFQQLDGDSMQRGIPPSNWSPLQVLDHLMKSNDPYLAALEDAAKRAPAGGVNEVRFGFLGKFLMRAAGPEGNAPAPKTMVPGDGPFTQNKLDEYLGQADQMLATIEKLEGKDLNQPRFPNPFIKLFKMSPADALEVATVHTERHVGQIEASLKR